MSFLRFYRRRGDGTLEFREAWHDAEAAQFVVNHGTVGHVSTSKSTDDVDAAAGEALLGAFAAQCGEDGYAEIPESELHRVVAQFSLKTQDGTERDRFLERQAVGALAAYLAWRGLGTVDGSSLGSGKLTIFTRCVEPNKAVAAVKTCLREATSDFTKLSIAVAGPDEPEAFKLKHAPAGVRSFSL
ncbi:hypothetical protein [Sinomonas sp. ASV322]|uniref:hypothetical protein n=1 Tax=Sinomonas sp. ASV322 TaxID=3041920 RepID=UPI0027DDB682|nr:hypothetical protein [Sinomonas sp. ASV322]MDQ4500880.1 hypothetical protein [Sinomonas sp. ASV322]